MKIHRRDLIKLGIVNMALAALPAKASSQENQQTPVVADRKGASILQGATDNTKTQFSILYDHKTDLDVFVTNSQQEKWLPDDVQLISYPGHAKKITRVFFSKLDPDQVFTLQILDSNSQSLIDSRQFKTLDTTNPSLRFALCSCMDDSQHDPQIWRTIVSKQPQVIFFLGDFVYADKGASKGGADPKHLWKRFSEARTTLEIFYSKFLIPIIGVWDDHDFGLNDSDSQSYPFVKESQKNYLSFFAQEESHCDLLTRGPGISSAFQYGQQLFILLDDRSFRKHRGSKDRYAHWGKEQEIWLLEKIDKNSGPAWLFNGSQIFPAIFWKESVSGDHPNQFQGLLEGLRKLKSKVIFGSGDVHYSEISQIESEAIGYTTYELTSSSIHSKGFPGTPDVVPNKRRITGTGDRNFVLVDSVAKDLGADFTATSFSIMGQQLFQKRLQV